LIAEKLKVGDTIPITFKLGDGNTTKFIQAVIFDESGVDLGASPITLTHIKNGFYQNRSLAMPDTEQVTVDYVAYDDVGLTILARYFQDADIFIKMLDSDTIILGPFGDQTMAVTKQDRLQVTVEENAIQAVLKQDKINIKESEDGVQTVVASDKIKVETDC